MTTTFRIATLVSIIGCVIFLGARSMMQTPLDSFAFAWVITWVSLILFVAVIVLGSISKTQHSAKGILLGLGINLLIGFAICTA